MGTTSAPEPGSASPAVQIDEKVDRILNDFLALAKKAFAERLSSIVLFGSAAEGRLRATSDVNLLIVLNEFQQKDISDMAQTLRLAQVAIRLKVMYLLVNEVQTAIECFAQKFGDIVRRHRVLYGPDPFEGLAPSRPAEVYRLRQVIFNLQLRMRQGFAELAGQEDRLALRLADLAGPLRTCAAALSRLENQGNYPPKEAFERLVNSFGRADLTKAALRVSEIRQLQAPSAEELVETYFLILDVVERIRSRAWRLE